MSEKENTPEIIESGEEMSDADTDYVSAINELKANTVSKELYNALRNRNKQLLDALVKGQTIPQPSPQSNKDDIDKLRKKLFNGEKELTNLEYVECVLDLRDALMDAGEIDPFLPIGDKVKITADMCAQAQEVADGLRSCVDASGGDSGVFTAQLQRITKDVQIGRKFR